MDLVEIGMFIFLCSASCLIIVVGIGIIQGKIK